MHKISFVLACLTCAGHGRRVRGTPEQESQEPLNALATLLQAHSPTSSFNPSGPAARAPVTRRSLAANSRRAATIQMEEATAAQEKEVPFEIRFPLGNTVTVSGGALFVYSLGSFLSNNGASDIVATLGFVYAIPALVAGLALKYAEVAPVNLDTTPEAEKLRESKATKVQQKMIRDSTRFMYGDAHMADPLRNIKLVSEMDIPKLQNLREEVTEDGEYSVTMRFTSPETPYRLWKERGERYPRFFGPGVRCVLTIYDREEKQVELSVITCPPDGDFTTLEKKPDGTLTRCLNWKETQEERIQLAKEKAAKEGKSEEETVPAPAEERGAV